MIKKLVVSTSPHLKSGATTASIMLDVIISLLPAWVMSIVYFGTRAIVLTLVTVLSAVLSEYVSRRVMKRSNTLSDLSAVVTGLILALNLPVTIDFWMAAVGSVIAIVVVKQMFGGIGSNFVNPAMMARIILMVSFPMQMSKYILPFENAWSPDAVTAATPMALLSGYDGQLSGELPTIMQMLFGFCGGSMGEVCSLALICGGVYLIVRKVISPAIPLVYIGTVAAFMLVYSGFDLSFTAYQLLGGGLMLGAFFMATDYATSPLTIKGKIIYAVGCGLITCAIRAWGSMSEGVSFSIILMNILTAHIDRFTRPRPFGKAKDKKLKKEADGA